MSQEHTHAGDPVVVGIDGSEHSARAADLAAAEAARRECPLEIVHAFVPPMVPRPATAPPDLPPVAPMTAVDDPELLERVDQLLHDTAERVREAHPDLPVLTRRHDGFPSEVLVAASHHAQLLVLGHRGVGGFASLLIGSVAVQVANHATCPVIIVRGEPPAPDAPVVVGVDGSDGARRAAEFAAETAALYGVLLRVVYAGPQDPGWEPARAQAGFEPPGVPAAVEQLMNDLVQAYPHVAIEPQIRHAQPGHEALVAASRTARLVAVGSRGMGGFKGLLLGSTSHALIHHAECPVVVVGPHVGEAAGAERPGAGQ